MCAVRPITGGMGVMTTTCALTGLLQQRQKHKSCGRVFLANLGYVLERYEHEHMQLAYTESDN